MRKALIGLIMAATVMTPIAAQAQDRDRDERRAANQFFRHAYRPVQHPLIRLRAQLAT